MLSLASRTPVTWVQRVAPVMNEVLHDHAHCEMKAASTAMNLIFRYQDRANLMRPLSELAREELEHFELLLGVLAERGIPFAVLEPSPYAKRLHQAVRKTEPERYLDTLLCCALIEARSCERMRLLAEGLEDPALAELYRGLLATEARHHVLYVDLAEQSFERSVVRGRLAELAEREAAIVEDLPASPRLHDQGPAA
jgi:tRNA-(ms[2]io[6]A)-hydroxylase